MGIIDPTEMEDYRSILHSQGYTENEFEIHQSVFRIPPNEPHPLQGLVKIKHSKTGLEREYQAGSGYSWVVAFEEDLKNKVYK